MGFAKKVKYCKASVIIPNWNGVQLLKVCLEGLQKQTFSDFEVVVVDNGSNDGSAGFIKKKFPDVKLIELVENSGFAHAVNLGIKHCVGKYIILLNNDTKADKRFVEMLVKTADKKRDYGMIAAKMLQFRSPNLIDSAGDYIDVVGHANNIGLGEDKKKFEKAGEVFLVSGGASLFKREVFDVAGFFDEKYFAYMEDVDLCLRAQFKGIKGWYEPKAVVLHMHKETSKKNPAFLEYLQFRNMMMTIIKDFPIQILIQDLNFFKIILVNLNTCLFLIKKGFLKSALKAEIFIILNIFSLLKLRKQIQSGISVDREYLISIFRPKKITFFKLLGKGI